MCIFIYIFSEFDNRMKRIFLTEEQVNLIKGSYPIEPKKVLLVKKFLDANFKQGNMGFIGNKGVWEDKPIVALTDTSGNEQRNMLDKHLYQALRSQFNDEKPLFSDRKRCDKFLAVVMKAWYYGNILPNGLIKGVNIY